MTLTIINFSINLGIVAALIWFDRRYKSKISEIETKLKKANPALRRKK